MAKKVKKIMSNNEETIKHTPSFRVYAYLRTSTEEQDPNRAKEELIEFAKEHNVTISCFFIENASGTTLDRPELLRLIDVTMPGDILLVEHMDRLTRLDRKDWKSLFGSLKSKGIFIVSVGLPTTHNFFNIEFRKMCEKFPIMEMINDLIVEIMAQFDYEDNARRKIRIVQGLENAKKEV
jgi:DNA invertase Pin-like site-specific DNA recombinase